MSGGKKRSGFEITSVTSDINQTPTGQPGPLSSLSVFQSATSSSYNPQGSSSQPTTPSLRRKRISHDTSGQGSGSSPRFRLVKLAVGGDNSGGPGQPYHRGRWKCMDMVESWDDVCFRQVSNTMRQAHSLESLEMIGRDTYKFRSPKLAQPIRGRDRQEPALCSGSHSPTRFKEPINLKSLECKRTMVAQDSNLHLPQPPRARNVPLPLRFDANARGESVLGLSPAQPRPPSVGPCHPRLLPIQTRAAFSLDQTIFNLPGEPSSPSNSLIAIDNKIEQAMDLVKSHLMLAVREEVELLREQIRKLQEKNQQLERENLLLRTLTHTITHKTHIAHNTHTT